MRIRTFRASALALGLAVVVSMMMAVPGLAANTTVTVSPGDMHGWFFCDDQSDCAGAATGSLVAGPATPPLGIGSARLLAPTSSDGQIFALAAYQGTKLAEITALQYSTFVTSGGPPQAIALQFNIDSDVTDGNTGFQGRLVFEPYQGAPAGTVVQGVWQIWNPMAQGRWWGSGNPATRPISAACPQSSPCTWQQIVSAFPNAGIHPTAGAVIFKAGSGWTNFDGNVDAFTIGVSGKSTTYDFEPVATNKDACQNGGWQNVYRANGSPFKNQGDCVSYTNTGR